MKRTKLASLFMAMVLVLSSICAFSVSAEAPSYTAKYTATAPTIDGTVDAVWNTVEWAALSNHSNSSGTTAAPKFKVLHDASHVYILFQAVDNNNGLNSSGSERLIVGITGATPCAECDGVAKNGGTPCSTHKELNIYANGAFVHNFKGNWCGNMDQLNPPHASRAIKVDGGYLTYEIAINIAHEQFSAMNMTGSIGLGLEFMDASYNEETAALAFNDHFTWSVANPEHNDWANNAGAIPSAYGSLVLEAAPSGVTINETNFPDSDFRAYIKENFDLDDNDALDSAEIAEITFIDVSETAVTDLTGIEYFTALESLNCYGTSVSALDVSANTNLTYLAIEFTSISALDLSKNTKLISLYAWNSDLTEIDLSNNPELVNLDVDGCPLTELDLSANTKLDYLYATNIGLEELDVTNNPALEVLYCYGNNLTELDLGNNPELRILDCSYNKLTTLDLSANTELYQLTISENAITEIDLSNHPNLNTFAATGTNLTSIDLSACDELMDYFVCEDNTYSVQAVGGIFNLKTLPGNFDAQKASNWDGCISAGNMIIVTGLGGTVTYEYDTGNGETAYFTLEVKNVPTATGGTSTGGTTTGGNTSAPAEPWENPYSDIADDHPNIDAIEYVTQKGIFKGTDANNPTFSEDVVLTRAQFVTILGRLAEVDTSKYTAKVFSDVDPNKASDAWFAPYVAWANENGIVLGYTDGTFGPSDEITVEQAITILGRFARYEGKYGTSLKTLDAFADADNVSSWALADMQWAVEKGLYTGEEGSLRPKALTDRLLTAILVYLYDITL